MNRTATTAATILAPIAWGTTYLTVTELLPQGQPFLLAASRVVPAGLVLVIGGLLFARWRPRGGEWKRTITLGFFNFALMFPLLIIGIYRLPGGVAAAVGGLQPLLVAGISRLVSGRKPSPVELAVGLAAAAGVGLIVLRPGVGIDPIGVLAAIGANASFATGVVLTKRFAPPSNRVAAAGWQLLLSGLVLVPLALAIDGMPATLTVTSGLGFAYLSLAATAAAFVLWFNGIRRLPVVAPPLLGLAAPITGAALGWIVLGESLSALQLAGFVIAIGAISYGAMARDADEAGATRRQTASRPGLEPCPAEA